jgi:hypothetical protein
VVDVKKGRKVFTKNNEFKFPIVVVGFRFWNLGFYVLAKEERWDTLGRKCLKVWVALVLEDNKFLLCYAPLKR